MGGVNSRLMGTSSMGAVPAGIVGVLVHSDLPLR